MEPRSTSSSSLGAMSSRLSFWALTAALLLTLSAMVGVTLGLGPNGSPGSRYLFLLLWTLHLLALLTALLTGARSLQIALRGSGVFGAICSGAALLAWTLSAVLGLLPISARDSLIHHLAVPKWWLAEGRIFSLPWHDWSFYPMLLQTGFSGLMELGLTQLTPWYHLLYGILLAMVVGELLWALTSSRRVQVFGVSLIALLPAAIKLGSIPLVDLGLALYATLTFSYLHQWIGHKRSRALIGAGLSLGFALSVKYNGLLFIVSLAPFAILAAHQAGHSIRQHARALVIVGIFAFLAFLPWAGRNWILTGNPVFPLYRSVFGPVDTTPADPRAPGGLSRLESRIFLHGESLVEVALLPLRVFVSGEDDNPRLFDGRLSPFLLLAIIPAILLRRQPTIQLLAGTSFLYFFLSLLMADARVRYLAPLYGAFAVLAAIGAYEIEKRWKNFSPPKLLSLVLLGHAAWATVYGFGLITRELTFPYFSGGLSRQEYLERKVPEFKIASYMNANLDNNSLTYMVLTGNRFYYFDTPVLSSGHASARELLRWIREADRGSSLYEKFSERRITHLLLHAPRLSKLFESDLTASELAHWNSFREQHLQLLAQDSGAILFSLH